MSITNSYFRLSWFSVCLNSWEISFPHILHSVFPCCSKITLLSSWVRLASIWLILNVNIPYSIVAFSRAQHARIIVLVHTVWACCFYHPNSLSVWDKNKRYLWISSETVCILSSYVKKAGQRSAVMPSAKCLKNRFISPRVPMRENEEQLI